MRSKVRRGFTLSETIVSFFLMTFAVLAVINLFPGNLRMARRSELSLQAQSVADEALEQARASGFSKLTPGAQAPVEIVRNGVKYQRVLEVSAVAGQDLANLKSLKVRVSWQFSGRPGQLIREVWVSNVRS